MSFKTAFFAFLKGEKSQTELEAYRRATNQIDDLEATVQTQVLDRPLGTDGVPWSRARHEQLGMVFAWIARALTTIANTMLETDEREDPATAGYLSIVTFGQAKELYIQVPDYVHRAWEALANPRYAPDKPLPLPLSPRVEADGKCPLIHLKGILAAAQTLDSYAQVRMNSYLSTVRESTKAVPAEVTQVLDEMAQIRARAQSKIAFSSAQLSVIAQGSDVPMNIHEEAETRLWEALCDYFLLGQFLAMPELLQSAAVAGHNATGRVINREERWFMSEGEAVRELKNTKFGEMEINEFWARKGWRTTPREERYLAQTEQYKKEGSISVISRWSTTPFMAVYQTLKPLSILDVPLDRGVEFILDMDENKDELLLGTPRFRRMKGYQEDHEEGHLTDPSGH